MWCLSGPLEGRSETPRTSPYFHTEGFNADPHLSSPMMPRGASLSGSRCIFSVPPTEKVQNNQPRGIRRRKKKKCLQFASQKMNGSRSHQKRKYVSRAESIETCVITIRIFGLFIKIRKLIYLCAYGNSEEKSTNCLNFYVNWKKKVHNGRNSVWCQIKSEKCDYNSKLI